MSWAISQVESNDDLLTIILVRLPPKSIFKFRCVSKRWKSIVATPTFLESYRNRKGERMDDRKHVIALIQRAIIYYIEEPCEKYMNILPVAQTHNIDHQQIDTSSKLGTFISSSNGLILCGRFSEVFHIFNPLTRKKVRIPPPRVCKSLIMTLVCEKSTDLVPNYKVIVHDGLRWFKNAIGHHYFSKSTVDYRPPPEASFFSKATYYFSEAVTRYFSHPSGSASEAETNSQSWMMIETYSSKTGKWVTSKLAVTEPLKLNYERPLVVDGIIHWYDGMRGEHRLAIYDSNGDDGNHVQLIELPRAGYYSASRSSREDPLWYGMNKEGCLKLWVLPRGESTSAGYKRSSTIRVDEWVLCSTIRYDSLSHSSINFDCQPEFRLWAAFSNLSMCDADSPMVLEEIIPWKPCMFALLTRDRKFYLLNLETRSVELVQYHGDEPEFPGQNCHSGWFAYLEPFCLSSYAL